MTKLQALLANSKWQVQALEEVTSTNSLLKELGRNGAPHGTVLIARRQTGGRGRLGRSFQSQEGGLYFSALIRPDCAPQELMHLTCAAAVAACDAVEAAFGFRPQIKWTNDLVVGRRKLGGILTELAFDGPRVAYAVIGIGINCNQTEFDASIQSMACSARMVLGAPVDRDLLAAELVRALEAMDLRSPAPMLERYRSDCMTLGQRISIVRGEETRHALALDVDAEGGLIVRYDSGETGTVTSGEVSVRGLYGYV